VEEIRVLQLIKVDEDGKLQSMYAEAEGLLRYAKERVVACDADLEPAAVDLSMMAKLKKAMDERRKEYLVPFQNHIKEVNEAYKSLMAPVIEADEITRRKILDYKAEQEKRRAAEAEINRLRTEAARAEAKLNDGAITESVGLVPVSAPAPKTIRTDLGTTGTRKVRKWELIDFKQVPDELKVLDAGKISKLVKAGIGSIAGIRIWDDEILTVTTGKE
jgi:hypothetical protein